MGASRTLPGAVLLAAVLATTYAALGASHALAQPEMRGRYTVDSWDAGTVSAASINVPTRVYYPTDAPGPVPVVAVIHGASSMGSQLAELATTLSSRGFVCVVPTMPCSVLGCDHDANAAGISALLEWAVARGADGSSPIAGRVDGGRRGVIGHSWGGLNSVIATSRDASISSAVYLDPNDDRGVGAAAAPSITIPAAVVYAQVKGACNSAWTTGATDALAGPRFALTISRSGHCDAEDSTQAICEFACGAGEGGNDLFRRYAVAFTACVLAADPEVAGYIGGADLDADVAGSRVMSFESSALDTLPCRTGVLPPPPPPTPPPVPPPPPSDAGPVDDAGAVPPPTPPPPGTDSGTPGALDSGTPPPAGDSGAPPADSGDEGGGCGCAVPGQSNRHLAAGGLLWVLLAGLLGGRRFLRRH